MLKHTGTLPATHVKDLNSNERNWNHLENKHAYYLVAHTSFQYSLRLKTQLKSSFDV